MGSSCEIRKYLGVRGGDSTCVNGEKDGQGGRTLQNINGTNTNLSVYIYIYIDIKKKKKGASS